MKTFDFVVDAEVVCKIPSIKLSIEANSIEEAKDMVEEVLNDAIDDKEIDLVEFIDQVLLTKY